MECACFFYTGEMKPFNIKEYKRYRVLFNLFKKDCILLEFTGGAEVNDPLVLLKGDYTDGRSLAMFYSMDDVESKEKAIKKVIKNWLKILDK